jgi:hypothetical protein
MTDYVYGPPTFGSRNDLAPGVAGKVISGLDFDTEFDKLVVAVSSKLNSDNPVITGEMNTGDVNNGSSINGGIY